MTGSHRPFLRCCLLGAAAAACFLAGIIWARVRQRPEWNPVHLKVNQIADYTTLVDPSCPVVRACARRLGSHEAAYYFVRDSIDFDPTVPASSPKDTLKSRTGSCLGKAALLCSLYRAMGAPPDSVCVVTGHVSTEDTVADHAWVDFRKEDSRYQQDPSPFLGVFSHEDFPGVSYREAFVRREAYCFNDRGFAVISRLNSLADPEAYDFPDGVPD